MLVAHTQSRVASWIRTPLEVDRDRVALTLQHFDLLASRTNVGQAEFFDCEARNEKRLPCELLEQAYEHRKAVDDPLRCAALGSRRRCGLPDHGIRGENDPSIRVIVQPAAFEKSPHHLRARFEPKLEHLLEMPEIRFDNELRPRRVAYASVMRSVHRSALWSYRFTRRMIAGASDGCATAGKIRGAVR